ncbi:MAG: hypothetical protein O2931_17500, partial [Planctomycetota bacterium]|nr:hypothetical protein [Planctomycetota bacterium]
MEAFFLEKYEPTPLLSPWNKGCGFFKANDPGLVPLENSLAHRFERFRCGVTEARKLLAEISQADAAIRAIKARTKTTVKGFQTEEQCQLLEGCDTYRGCLDQLQSQLSKPDLVVDKRAEVEGDISTIRSLVQPAEKPPQRADAEALKDSTGYKRLLATAERHFKSLKVTLIPDCRRLWRGPHAEWLSAAVVLDEQGNPEWPSLLGT